MTLPGENLNLRNAVYFESLTGFRGLAALFILLFHSLLPCFSALWIGVPMFFVLSGFLITRILIERSTSGNYLKAFYYKRALRIFPAYYLALLISVFWALLVHGDFSQFPLFLVYLQNFNISRDIQPDYCYGLMNHTWSLSVEELFYLAWPLVILATPRKWLIHVIVTTGALSILYKITLLTFFYNDHTGQLLQLSLPGNLDGLMAGALLGALSMNTDSFLHRRFPSKQLLAATFIFLFVFGINYLNFTSYRSFTIFKELLSVLTAVISFYGIAWFVSGEASRSLLSKAFNHPFMQYTGKISYGLYLYHALVFGITDACIYHFHIAAPVLLLFVFKLCMSYLAAALSWRFIETPFLKLKDKVRYRP